MLVEPGADVGVIMGGPGVLGVGHRAGEVVATAGR